MRASVWLVGLSLLVGGYAVLLVATQATMSDRLSASPGSDQRNSVVTGWSERPVGEQPQTDGRVAARASSPDSPAVTFNRSAPRLRADRGQGRVELDALVPPVSVLPELPAAVRGPGADLPLVAGGLVWIVGLSAAAAALRRRA